MKSYDELEEKAIKRSRVKKPKMKVSGKSVFVLAKAAGRSKKK